jgi:glucose/arabinose dehydrogenase
VLVRKLRTPLGLAWRGRTLFVSEQGLLERFTLRGGRLVDRRVVVKSLPFGRHQQDNVVLGRDGRLYWGSGSACDACRERNPRSATILSLRPDGTDLRIYARGLRNPDGLAFQPGTGRLYASVNGQDELGTARDPEPAEMVVVARRGGFYGWPRCWPNARTLSLSGSCRGVSKPAAYLEPHSSADGVAFYTGRSFPRGYRGNLFVAEWGEYLTAHFGRRVVRVELRSNGTARRVSVRLRLRASAGAAGRPPGRAADSRLGPRHRLPDPGPRADVSHAVLSVRPLSQIPRTATIGTVEEELVSRQELTATLFAVADIREDVRKIRRLLEEDDGEAEEDEP